MYFIQQEISPDIAREMLSRNFRNRPLNAHRVASYASSMLHGEWTQSPSPICFDTSGHLKDGQHRLSAIIKANIPVSLTIAYDVPSDCVIDKGLARSTGDSLYMRGLVRKELCGTQVIAMVNRYLEILNNGNPSSDDDKAAFITANEQPILDAVSISKKGSTKPICSKAGVQAALLGAILHGVDKNKLDAFARIVNTGFMDSPSQSPAIILRNYILATRLGGGGAANELAAYAQMAIRDFINETPRRTKYKKKENVYIA